MCTVPCSSCAMLQESTSSAGRGIWKSNPANSRRNLSMSIRGITDPSATRSMALASSRVNRSSMCSRVSQSGKSAGAGRGSGFLMDIGGLAGCGGERLVEVGDDVVDVLDTDTQPYRLRADSSHPLLLGRHLT